MGTVGKDTKAYLRPDVEARLMSILQTVYTYHERRTIIVVTNGVDKVAVPKFNRLRKLICG